MAQASNIRAGTVIMHQGELYRIVSKDHVTPGKGRAHIQTKIRRLSDGSQTEHRFRPSEDVETPRLDTQVLQYLYQAGDLFNFMNQETYDQIALDKEILGDRLLYMKEGIEIKALMHEGKVIDIELPITVDLEIAETQPPMKGATASGGPKPATLETGLQVKVPQHLNIGAVVRIDTRDNSFVQKVG
ncbi:MAG: elongation factor P [Candidatus Eisenbacteria sp.]|nr:elongation factor P [Candidatus Eisenbacteria bacterium]